MGDISYGGKAGLLFSTLTGSGISNVSVKVGAYFGGIVELPVIGDFYIQPELLFSLQGARYDLGSSNVNLAYIQIPVMAKYHITDEFAVELGPQVGFLLADNWEEDLQLENTEQIEFALNIGGGYRMDENFYFQIRIGAGITQMLETTKAYNGSISAGVVYFLD